MNHVEREILRRSAAEDGIYIAVHPPSGKKTHLATVESDRTVCGSKLSAAAALFRVQEHRVSAKDACASCYPKDY